MTQIMDDFEPVSQYDNAFAAWICSSCHSVHDTLELMAACHGGVEMPPVQAPELLGRAARHMHDRASTYDAPGVEHSMGKAVTAFNAITGYTLSESEGWLLLQVLKDVRLFARPAYHADSAEDCIAYAALKAEARGEGR